MPDRFVGPGLDPDRDGWTDVLDVDRRDVYRAALDFQGFVSGLRFPRSMAHLRDQLDRAPRSS
jgi:hypothetical protein